MDQFDQIFNLSSITEAQRGHLEWVLNSPSYRDFFRPYIEQTRTSMVEIWKNPKQTEYSSDYLRCGVNICDGLLAFFDRIVEETQYDRVVTSRGSQIPEQMYEQMKENGLIRSGAPVDDGYPVDQEF